MNKLTTFPRIIKTHLHVQLIPKSFWEQNSKVPNWDFISDIKFKIIYLCPKSLFVVL